MAQQSSKNTDYFDEDDFEEARANANDSNKAVPPGQEDVDDWFSDENIGKYRTAAGIAYEYSKKKMEDAGEQERRTIEKGASEQRKTEASQEARDNRQAREAYRF